jgi:hypothetical protein
MLLILSDLVPRFECARLRGAQFGANGVLGNLPYSVTKWTVLATRRLGVRLTSCYSGAGTQTIEIPWPGAETLVGDGDEVVG